MNRLLLAGFALCTAAAAPAAALTTLTWNFGGANGTVNTPSLSRTVAGVELTASARRFTRAPNSLTDLSQTTTGARIQASMPGIGVEGGASGPQLDTNQGAAREGILFSSTKNFSINGFKLSFVDGDDTLQIYGVNANGSLVSLGFNGVIRTGLAGAAPSPVVTTANSGTVGLMLADPTFAFRRYLFTTMVGGDVQFMGTAGQGYRIDSITGAVPEPATWAMMITGFGLVGAAGRRQRKARAAT